MTILKKTILSAATLGLSLGIFSTASAKEISTPISPIPSNLTSEDTVVTPYNLQKQYSETTYYDKTQYLIPAQIPSTKSVTVSDGQGVWTGTLYKKTVTESASKNGWWVVYSGTITLY